MYAFDEQNPIDLTHLTEISGGDHEFEAELMQEFLRSTPRILDQLREAIRQGQHREAELNAHALKGSCRSLGAKSMAEPCSDIELMARAGDLSGAEEKERLAVQHFEVLRRFIQDHWDLEAA